MNQSNNKTKISFDSDGLIPMIIQDSANGVVLSLFYANKEAIEKTIKTGYVWRYSRSNGKLMKKGASSGNFMKVVSLSLDCDGDALLVKVKPSGPACHSGKISCFGTGSFECFEPSFTLDDLVAIISERKKNPNPNSYTSKLLDSKKLIVEKLREELDELLEAKTKKAIKWESSDLLYFLLVYLENAGVRWTDVLNELKKRRKKPSRYSSYTKPLKCIQL
ncbi:bifunctional phosphoribosyl-AMP cyclohydrolase/phosphoribosyl-ATP diphosphatase HisIE [Candidatus Micrarchaeota archaeon]|nr:bifunctional phosphoribosyl-AMP cyclohydrolase/phosphoribosyl-ATP diphosphatase HisIE [Candidatus Micrarchaeota archaeon]